MVDNYQELALAVVEQAIVDYTKAVTAYKNRPCYDTRIAVKMMEKFFIGDWCELLLQETADGKRIISIIKKRMGVNL